MRQLVRLYRSGLGVPHDPAEAEKLDRKYQEQREQDRKAPSKLLR
jgi:hypothetical protein